MSLRRTLLYGNFIMYDQTSPLLFKKNIVVWKPCNFMYEFCIPQFKKNIVVWKQFVNFNDPKLSVPV